MKATTVFALGFALGLILIAASLTLVAVTSHANAVERNIASTVCGSNSLYILQNGGINHTPKAITPCK